MVNPTVSTANSKLGKQIASVNLPAGITCRPDAPCRNGCYALKGRFMFKSTRACHERNLQSFFDDKENYFNYIAGRCSLERYAHFRWHSSGDIVNDDYLAGIVRVAAAASETKFLCFTKKYELVNNFIAKGGKIPENLTIVFSCWGDFVPDNPYDLPTSYARFNKVSSIDSDENIPDDAVECKGSCKDCVHTEMNCWNLKNGQSVVFNKH